MNRILFLDNSIETDAYHPLAYWGPLLMFPYDSYRVCRDELPTELDAYSHIFLSGSSASVLDNADWMQAEMELIRVAVDRGKPILGSCFGHQIIAGALLGMDTVRRRKAPEIGWPDIEIIADDALFGRRGRIINSFVFHFDEVCNLPENRARVIARSGDCGILVFKLNEKPVWGIQPHFEMGIVEGLKYIETVQSEGVPSKQSFFNSVENYPKDSGWVIPLLKAFYQNHHEKDCH